MTDVTNSSQPANSDKVKDAAGEMRAIKALLHYKLQTAQQDVTLPDLTGKSGWYAIVNPAGNGFSLQQSPAGAGSAGDLASQLADSSDPFKGSGLVNYNHALAYAGGSVGKAIQSLYKFCQLTQPIVIAPITYADITGSYTPNPKLAFLEVCICGSGGSGGGSPAPGPTTQYCIAGSGGGSPYARLLIPGSVILAYAATNGGVINYCVGARVAGGVNVVGTDGHASWFGRNSGDKLINTPGGIRGSIGIPTASSTYAAFPALNTYAAWPYIASSLNDYIVERVTGGPPQESFQVGGLGVVGKSGSSKFGAGVPQQPMADQNGRDAECYGEGGGGSWRLHGASTSSGGGGTSGSGYLSLTEILLPN